jgi:hypothetical protein
MTPTKLTTLWRESDFQGSWPPTFHANPPHGTALLAVLFKLALIELENRCSSGVSPEWEPPWAPSLFRLSARTDTGPVQPVRCSVPCAGRGLCPHPHPSRRPRPDFSPRHRRRRLFPQARPPHPLIPYPHCRLLATPRHRPSAKSAAEAGSAWLPQTISARNADGCVPCSRATSSIALSSCGRRTGRR